MKITVLARTVVYAGKFAPWHSLPEAGAAITESQISRCFLVYFKGIHISGTVLSCEKYMRRGTVGVWCLVHILCLTFVSRICVHTYEA
jgi:S-adenosylmethionine/arginine decarboxylase-like enzyme